MGLEESKPEKSDFNIEKKWKSDPTPKQGVIKG